VKFMPDTIIEKESNSNSVIVAVVLVIGVLLVLFFFGSGMFRAPATPEQVNVPNSESSGQGGEGGEGGDINVDVPDKIDVNLENN
jgi:uncharacterized membrane protein YqiK